MYQEDTGLPNASYLYPLFIQPVIYYELGKGSKKFTIYQNPLTENQCNLKYFLYSELLVDNGGNFADLHIDFHRWAYILEVTEETVNAGNYSLILQ